MQEKRKYSDFRRLVVNRMKEPEAVAWSEATGISGETAARLGLGFYDPKDTEARAVLEEADPDLAEAIQWPAIMATYESDRGDYVTAINADPQAGLGELYINPAGPAPIWNDTDLYASSGRPIFAVMDLRDGLALAETGAEVVLFGTGSEAQLIGLMKTKPASGPIVFLPEHFGNDDNGGLDMLKEYAESLGRKGVYPMVYDDFETVGDYPGAWRTLEDQGIGRLTEIVETVGDWVKRGNKAAKAEYMATSAKGQLTDFENLAYTDKPHIKTGYDDLDDLIRGIYPGLYIIGAVSSVGKTTFCLQMADQLAEGNPEKGIEPQDVLFFTLEQSANELMAKSISRLSDTLEMLGAPKPWAGTILHEPEALATTYREAFITSIDYYRENIAGRVYFIEDDTTRVKQIRNPYTKTLEVATIDGEPVPSSDRRVGLDTIKRRIEEHEAITGRRPIVFIDYLQILKPDPELEGATDKQVMDAVVSELRRLSKDHGIPIIAISSLNRASYYGRINLSAFKESGAIEYSTDVLIGLQPAGLKDGDDKTTIRDNIGVYRDFKAEHNKRKVEVSVLKNRMGSVGNVVLDNYPCFDRFATEEIDSYENLTRF